MKSDIPSLGACKRLAEAGLIPPAESGNIWWWVELPPDSPFLTRCPVSERLDLGVYTYAPTIGEMLAEIRRRGWQVSLSTVGYGSAENRFKATVWRLDKGECARRRIILGHAVADEPADALALALAEAVEKEGKA